MPTDRERIRRFYAGHHDEWGRLESDLGAYEWATASRRIGAQLPPAPARVLDVGGGPGRYAIWLSGSGYTVTLVDLSPNLVAEADSRATRAGVAIAARV